MGYYSDLYIRQKLKKKSIQSIVNEIEKSIDKIEEDIFKLLNLKKNKEVNKGSLITKVIYLKLLKDDSD